jgi:hypothetical protein
LSSQQQPQWDAAFAVSTLLVLPRHTNFQMMQQSVSTMLLVILGAVYHLWLFGEDEPEENSNSNNIIQPIFTGTIYISPSSSMPSLSTHLWHQPISTDGHCLGWPVFADAVLADNSSMS